MFEQKRDYYKLNPFYAFFVAAAAAATFALEMLFYIIEMNMVVFFPH